jgi:hypothetical protein
MQMMGKKDGTVTSEQMRNWDLTPPLANPPNVARAPSKLVHIRQYLMDTAYVRPYAAADTRKAFKQRIYDALTRNDEAKNGTPELRIMQKHPATPYVANMEKPTRSSGDRHGKIGMVCGHS